MIEFLTLLIVAISGLVALQKWWRGVWLCVVIGFIQDPLRKVIPDQPVYMVALVAVVIGAVVVGLLIRKFRFSPSNIPGWNNGVAPAMSALMIVLAFQLIYSYVAYQSLFIVGLGVLTYIAPLLAIFVGYYFSCHLREEGLEKFIKFYSVFCLISTLGIYMEYFGVESQLFGEVGSGLIIYDVGTILIPYSGLFRSSEIAAWHVFFGSSLMMILAVRSKSSLGRILWIFGVIFLVSAGVLTGRRKLVVTVIIFITIYWLFMLVFLRRAFRIAVVILLLGASSIWIAIENNVLFEGGDAVYGLYVERASGVFGDIKDRVQTLGISTVVSAVKNNGLFGSGAGSSSQGVRFSGVKTEYEWVAEGGVARIVVEIGLFGLLIVMWLVIAIINNTWKIFLYLTYKKDSFSTICFGLVAILIANFAHFLIAAQVFSDPFILLLLGLILGVITSSPMLIKSNKKYSKRIENDKSAALQNYQLS